MIVDPQIVTALVGLAGTLGGTWLGAHLNSRSSAQTTLQLAEVEKHKYKQDRLWDARKEAYTLVVVEFNAMNRAADRMYDWFFGQYADPEHYFQSAQYDKDSEELWSAFRRAKALVHSNALVISAEFERLYGEWEGKFLLGEDGDPPERADYRRGAMAKYLPKLVELAKAEIATVT